MKRFISILGAILITSCSQFGTNEIELEQLRGDAENKAANYLQCMQEQTEKMLSVSRDAAFLVDRAKSACAIQLGEVKNAQSALLRTQYILINDELEKAIKALDDQSSIKITEILLSNDVSNLPAANRLNLLKPSDNISSQEKIVSPKAFKPSFDQRVYMDCMSDQAEKYVSLNESASAIADVAASRCRSYLDGVNQSILEQEGRALTMGRIFDLRLQGNAR
ncbi:MAG: hypothetical protein VYA80_02690 [Pseudomonadota bacterium]|nr:hypothetical protein [Pseudomonadota bacterium]